MDRKLPVRKLRRRLAMWQGLGVGMAALLLMGSGVAGVTGSRLFVNADATSGDKVVIKVGSDEVFKVSHNGTSANVSIDPGAGGSVSIKQIVLEGGGTHSGSQQFGDGPDDRFRLPRLAADPVTNVFNGMIYYNTTANQYRVYQNGSWQTLGLAGGVLPAGAVVFSNNDNEIGMLSAGYVRDSRLDSLSGSGTLPLVNAPTARASHSAVWTGSRMLVWGGLGSSGNLNTGASYDPMANTWTPISTTGAPVARREHSAVWTGSRMLVWGGLGSTGNLDTGGSYDPETDSWTAISTVGAPEKRRNHTVVWTGTHMLVWGGESNLSFFDNTGGAYHPDSDTWTTITTAGEPGGRRYHAAVWTGTHMLVWGGQGSGGDMNNGGRYHPGTDTWTAITTTGAPTARYSHTAVWTGSRMLVWGGYGGGPLNSGGSYDPGADSWTVIASTGVPHRHSHTAVWTGGRMLIWGGIGVGYLDSGGSYDPGTNTWATIPPAGTPSARYLHTAVAASGRMLIWGGEDGSNRLNTGAAGNHFGWGNPLYAFRAP